MNRMLATIAILCLCVTPAEVDAAAADRARIGGYPGNLVYFSTSHLDGEQREKTEAALAFIVSSASPQPIIERCAPVKISDTLYRVDLESCQWKWQQFFRAVAKYPHYYGGAHYVYHADWFVTLLGDTTQSDAYYRLLLNNANPSRNDFLKAFGVNNDASVHFGVIVRSQAALGPSVAGIRLVENRPTNRRTSAWGTRDSAKIDDKSDPLEHPENNFKHDAEEWIVSIPKQSLTTGDRAALMAFFLSNAKGQRQEEAPPAIVTDHLGFRNQQAIRNVGSCIGCHANGYLEPGVSELRSLISKGLDLYATPKQRAEKIEAFHLSDAGKQIARDNEDVLLGIKLTNGLDGEANAEAFRGVFDYYDRDLSLSIAAMELHVPTEELQRALAYSSHVGYSLGGRLASLPHGGEISRAAWEQSGYAKASEALYLWRKSK